MNLLRFFINSDQRQYFIDKVNAPLYKAISILGNRYPEPTRENIVNPNSIRLLELFEEYFKYEDNPRLIILAQALKRIIIAKNEHSHNYGDRISWFVEKLRTGPWKNRAYGRPANHWKEPIPYGGK
jgi:hypothetical protein